MFTHTLPDPVHDNDTKPCPSAWVMQIQTVEAMEEEGFGVELPKDIHALDKAAWQTALLNEVVFDMIARTIRCTFIDGSQVTWPLSLRGSDASCIASLEGVVEDVHGLSREHERERYRSAELYVQTSSYHSNSGAHSTPSSPISTTSSKAHKRQRSLFSSIVAAVKGALSDNNSRNLPLPLSLPPVKILPSSSGCHARTPSTFSRTQISPPTSPTAEKFDSPLFQLRVRPRAHIPPPLTPERLRRRARSTLVDIVRRHVYPMLSTTGSPSFAEIDRAPEPLALEYGFPLGLYPGWITRSVLRKTEERMREMMAEANAYGFGHTIGLAMDSHSRTVVPLRDPEDEDDDTSASTSVSATTASTETDGSSVHTPTDPHLCPPFPPSNISPYDNTLRLETKAPPSQVPRSPSPPSPTFDFDMPTYHALTALRSRLLNILSRMGSSPRQANPTSHYGSDLTILEVKSRRRAWSSRDYVGGARMSLVGLATPFRSSPLARCEPVNAEALARIQAQVTREPSAFSHANANRSMVGLSDLSAEFGVSVSLGVRAVTKEMDVRLFPVCEEEEEESEHGLGYQSGCGLDEYAEDEGWHDMHDLESGLFVFPRPTSDSSPHLYSHMHPMIRARTQSMRRERSPPPVAQPGALSPNSLLCQPLNVKVPVPVMLDQGGSFEYDIERGAEFTLAMDLPPPPREWSRDDPGEVSCR